MEESELMQNTREAIIRIHQLDAGSLVRNSKLGTAMNFEGGVRLAKRLKELYLEQVIGYSGEKCHSFRMNVATSLTSSNLL